MIARIYSGGTPNSQDALSKLSLLSIQNFTPLLIRFKFKKFERDTLTQVATFFVLATGLLFSQYYIPDIITMQEQGEAMTQSLAFVNTHKGSEINSKIFAFALIVLIVQNMRKACK